ncbi:hypothetical protein [Umezawaea tangerina]|uniref:Uncharacterized protein n=1 Tax=Umezawaea tangerina TaxID=84725 RepID=A0A2T0TKX1_9PSEU|nr:hypothetical protein [Umezawaea tangerina]PRY46372.1 hypothetical protein CLV43_101648 [Umezawaea tangerina]
MTAKPPGVDKPDKAAEPSPPVIPPVETNGQHQTHDEPVKTD